MLDIKIDHSWQDKIGDEFCKPYFNDILFFIEDQGKSGKQIYPSNDLIFEAFNQTPFDKVKVVIIGQDPYHREGQAHGLSFSVPHGVKPPPSLKNIFKELKSDDLNFPLPQHGNLEKWAAQGVLLLNSVLTVNQNEPASHQNVGWQKFTDTVIEKIATERENVVFLLWGKFAQSKSKLINEKKHLILKSSHPSPLSAYRGFFGCRHFSKTNFYLYKKYGVIIDWSL